MRVSSISFTEHFLTVAICNECKISKKKVTLSYHQGQPSSNLGRSVRYSFSTHRCSFPTLHCPFLTHRRTVRHHPVKKTMPYTWQDQTCVGGQWQLGRGSNSYQLLTPKNKKWLRGVIVCSSKIWLSYTPRVKKRWDKENFVLKDVVCLLETLVDLVDKSFFDRTDAA